MVELAEEIVRGGSVHSLMFVPEIAMVCGFVCLALVGWFAKVRWLTWVASGAALEVLAWALLVSPWPWVIGWSIAAGVAVRIGWDYRGGDKVAVEPVYTASASDMFADAVGPIGPIDIGDGPVIDPS